MAKAYGIQLGCNFDGCLMWESATDVVLLDIACGSQALNAYHATYLRYLLILCYMCRRCDEAAARLFTLRRIQILLGSHVESACPALASLAG